MRDIKKAVIEAATAAIKLTKTDENQNDGYRFVPIDAFYEKIAPELLKRGVFWTVTEESVTEYSDSVGWRLRFDLFYVAEEVEEEWAGVCRCTIFHPIDGPQATGKVFSYGEKVFMRSLLKLVTGEPDADVTSSKSIKPRALSARRSPQNSHSNGVIPEAMTPQAALLAASAIAEGLKKAVSLDEMKGIFTENRAFIEMEKGKGSKAYNAVLEEWNNSYKRVTNG
jgi:hypothetical protein